VGGPLGIHRAARAERMATQISLPHRELIPLETALAAAPPEHVLMDGFETVLTSTLVGGAFADRGVMRGTVGERTVVIELEGGERGVANIKNVMVDPGALVWVAKRGRARHRSEPPTISSEGDSAPSDAREVEHLALDVVDPGSPAESTRPSCARCRRPLSGRNRTGVCTACQSTCPTCSGPKGVQAQHCRGCAGRNASAQTSHLATAPLASEIAADQSSEKDRPNVDLMADAAATDIGVVDRHVGHEESQSCQRCGDDLPRQNRKGICTACQGTCPSCGKRKAVQAQRCQRCSRSSRAQLAEDALAAVGRMRQLPDQIRDLLDNLQTLAGYARALEDELEGYRGTQREIRRVSRRAWAALDRGS
jgi:hypothetical protein